MEKQQILIYNFGLSQLGIKLMINQTWGEYTDYNTTHDNFIYDLDNITVHHDNAIT